MSPEKTAPTVLAYDAVSNRFRAKGLEPTDTECARILNRHPTLTDLGLTVLERYQRENDWRAREGLPLFRHRQPVPLTGADQRRQIGLVRAYLREIQTHFGEPFSRRFCLSYELQRAVTRWASEYISNGAVIAGASLEGCTVDRYVASANAIISLSITEDVQARLRAATWQAVDYMGAALDLMPHRGS